MSVLKSIFLVSHSECEVYVSLSAAGELGGEREWEPLPKKLLGMPREQK